MTTEELEQLTAGNILLKARLAKGWSQQDVALHLNLKPELIEKIEQDLLDKALLATFVRGYLRAYARLLKVPEKDVMQAFDRHADQQTDTTKPMRTFSNRTGHQATENRFMWLTYAIGVSLVILLFIWWWQSARDTSVPAVTLSTPELEQQIRDVAAQSSETQIEPETLVPETLNPETLISETSVPERPTIVPPEPEITELQSTVDTTAKTSPDSTMSGDSLKMRFRENCWIDVLDADGNRVAYGTKLAGYVMELNAKAPFVITLGNPSVVTIELNNVPFDLSGFPGGRVAKFTLSGQD